MSAAAQPRQGDARPRGPRAPWRHLVLAATVALSACAATYQAPAGAPTAPVALGRGDSPALLSHTVWFRAFADGQCQKLLGSLGSVGLLSPQAKESALPTGTPIYLWADSRGTEFGSNINYRCTTLSMLVLQPGSRYEFVQDFSQGRCRLVERRSAAPGTAEPAAFQPVPVAPTCARP